VVQAEKFRIEPQVKVHEFIDVFGNRCGFVHAPAGRLRFSSDAVVSDGGEPDPIQPDARQHPVEELPANVLQFLLASRYCEVDRMGDMAWELFGALPPGWGKVQAVADWVHNHIEFGYGHASPTKTAYDVCNEKKGVCRDFMHLTITLLRCLNIPARYATGYLGDIGVPAAPFPMDFSAWLEVYLGGRWWVFDARHNKPRIGRVLMARGRDAVDVALTTSFGPSRLEKFEVWTDEVKDSVTVSVMGVERSENRVASSE
jgi:transglutaminase-like putative cysteine protease